MLKRLSWSRESLGSDLMAALTVALVSIPEGMAYALLAGVDPVYGLYTGMTTTIVASLTGSTSLMIVTLTNALALVTADALGRLSPDTDPVRAMFTLTLLVGVVMFLLGVLKLGSVIRFVSREVMSAFVFATALLIVLGQYDELVGYASTLDANKLVKAVDITLNISSWDLYTTMVGIGSIFVLLLLKRSPVRKFADVLIIILAGAFVLLIGWQTVELVGDVADVPTGLDAVPTPVLPDFGAIPALLGGALAAAVVGLAEASGAGAAYPNRDGSKSSMSRDFSAQGLGNMVGSFFQAMPAGGSLSRTGINASGGAQTRWAGVYAGLLILVVVMVFGNLTELIPMSALAAMLMVIGFEVMCNEGKDLAIAWRIDKAGASVAFLVVVVAVFAELTAAIFAGVVLSMLLYVIKTANRFKVLELVPADDGLWVQQAAPTALEDNKAIVIEVTGIVDFTSVYSFDEHMPDPGSAKNAAVVGRMRGREFHSLTVLGWLEKYVREMHEAGNLYLMSGVEQELLDTLEKTDLVEIIGPENIFVATERLSESTQQALAAARAWIEKDQSG